MDSRHSPFQQVFRRMRLMGRYRNALHVQGERLIKCKKFGYCYRPKWPTPPTNMDSRERITSIAIKNYYWRKCRYYKKRQRILGWNKLSYVLLLYCFVVLSDSIIVVIGHQKK